MYICQSRKKQIILFAYIDVNVLDIFSKVISILYIWKILKNLLFPLSNTQYWRWIDVKHKWWCSWDIGHNMIVSSCNRLFFIHMNRKLNLTDWGGNTSYLLILICVNHFHLFRHFENDCYFQYQPLFWW